MAAGYPRHLILTTVKAQFLPMVTTLEATLRYEGCSYAYPGAFVFPLLLLDHAADLPGQGVLFSEGGDV